MADIFLSYNEADREAVRRLSLALQSVGWSVWWDRRIPAGQTWRSVLSRELQNMRCMVVVWSATSVASEWVCEEAAEGRQSGKLIPVMIEPVRPPAGFRELQAADLIGWDGDEDFPGFQQLIEDIGRLIYVPEKPSQTGTPSQPFPLSEADQHSSAAAAPIKPAPPPVNPHDRWLWIGAGGALLAAMGTGFFAEQWRQRGLVQPPAPMAEAPAVPPAASKAVATGASGVLPGTATKSIVADMPGRGEMKPGTTTATTAADTPPKSATKRPSATNPRCAALQERQQLGETLSATSQRILQQEC